MSRSRKEVIRERARRYFDPARRFVPMWAMLRVYKRNDALDPPGQPDYWVPQIFGGLWDRREGLYVPGAEPKPADIVELPCFQEQLDVLLAPTNGKMRTMVLAGPGTGKTRLLSTASVLDGLELEWKDTGQVGATQDRVTIMWDDLLAVVQERAPHWIDRLEEGKRRRIILANGHRWDFRAAKEPSRRIGSPIQGASWARAKVDESQNVLDRPQMDIDERGRRAGTAYHVLESATNLGIPYFQARLESYKDSPHREIIRLNPFQNVFVTEAYWLRFKGDYSERDWKQRILSEDVLPEHLIYAAFHRKETIRPRPRSEYQDITRELTAERWGHLFKGRDKGWPWIVGHDPGRLCRVSVWLKAFRNNVNGRVDWWACKETVSGSGGSEGHHAKLLVGECSPSDFIVHLDPHETEKDRTRTSMLLMQREGITVVAAGAPPIEFVARSSMLSALLRDANGDRHFFIDCDEHRKPYCPGLVNSLGTIEYDEKGKPDVRKNGYRDPTHWPDAAQWGLWPYEQIRGQTDIELVSGYQATDALELKAAQYRARRNG